MSNFIDNIVSCDDCLGWGCLITLGILIIIFIFPIFGNYLMYLLSH